MTQPDTSLGNQPTPSLLAVLDEVTEALEYERVDAYVECADGRFEYRGVPGHGLDKALALIEQLRNSLANAERGDLTAMIHDMAIAHDMSHAAFCDGADWRDTFQDKYKSALAAATLPGKVDLEAGARAIVASDPHFAVKLSKLKQIDKAVKYAMAAAQAWGLLPGKPAERGKRDDNPVTYFMSRNGLQQIDGNGKCTPVYTPTPEASE